MRNFNSPTMKPTMVIVNDSDFSVLDLGPVPKGKRKRSQTTTSRYIDSEGRARYCGNSDLKKSQMLALHVAPSVHQH